MTELVIGTGAAAGAGALWWAWRVQRIRRISRDRLNEELAQREKLHYVVTLSPALRRYQWIAWCTGLAVCLVTTLLFQWALVYGISLGVIVGVMTWILENQIAVARTLRLELQLANAIDLMVGALSAGAGTTEALDSAVRESPQPCKGEFEEVLGRIRYGENPHTVWQDFGVRIPLETYRLLCFTMAVHSEVGGSLAPTLAQVGRAIRDRIEISRRIRSQSTEAQASVIGIVCITYFLGLLMWRTNPQHFEGFIRHPLGANFTAAAMILQALGLVWITKLSQLKY